MVLLENVNRVVFSAIAPHDGSVGIIEIDGGALLLIISVNANTIGPYVRQNIRVDEFAHGIASNDDFTGVGVEFWFTAGSEDAVQGVSRKACR